MAIRGPFTRWRLVEPIRDLEDVTKILRELELAYERLVYALEQGSDDAPGTGDAPADAQYLVAASDPTLTQERVFQSGTNTTFATTATTAQVNVPSATTAVQGVVELATDGQVAAGLAVQANDARLSNARTPLAHAASHRHGGSDEVATATAAANAIPKAGAAGTLAAAWLPDAILNTKGAIRLAGDLTGTATVPVVDGIRGNSVAIGTLTSGQVYRHDGTNLVAWSPKYMTATLSANQTTNLAGGNHVEFDTAVVNSGHITLSTGAGQADGIFTLPEGLWMIRLASALVDFSANTGVLILSSRQSVSSALVSPFVRFRPYDSASQTADAQNTEGLLDTRGLGSLDIELRIEAGTGSVTSINTATRVTIFALA